jgi:DNA-binding MarR family transcriptional regulator
MGVRERHGHEGQERQRTVTTDPKRRAAALREMLRLAPRLDRLTAENLQARGFTRARARLLLALDDGGPATMTELSRALEITPRAVTALVDALETLGHVRRHEHPSDRRATIVELTATGSATIRELRAGYRLLAVELFGGLSDRDLAATERVLQHVREALDARTTNGSAR